MPSSRSRALLTHFAAALLAACALLGALSFTFHAPAADARAAVEAPIAHAASTCKDYETQADAQRAADTVDADSDGLYCESLPCPCLKPGQGDTGDGQDDSSKDTGSSGESGSIDGANPKGCTKPAEVQKITFSKTKYPNIRKHMIDAIKKGWPSVLVLNRPGADARRDKLLTGWATKPGNDRDEFPPAVARGKGKGLTQGSDPRGWKADVRYVPSSENRSHGSTMGIKLRRFCNGTMFRYIFY
jgi:hypothetical protein